MRSPVPLVAACVVAAGCAGVPVRPGPESRAAPAEAGPLAAPDGGPAAFPRRADPEEPEGVLTLRAALALALLRSPALGAASLEVRAAEAARLQAGLLPNPELSYSMENTGGSLGGEAETTILLSQLVELGGKRAARLGVAAGERDLADRDYEAGRLDVLTATAGDFAGVLGAQARLRVAAESESIAGEVLAATRARAEAGAVGPVEVRRAEIEAVSAEIDRVRAAADLEGARASLAARWGGGPPRFTEAAGELAVPPELPPLEELVPLLERNPDLARFDAERALLRAEVDVARAGRVPDVTLGAGRRRFHGTGDHAYLVELTLPLPLFDRNQGAVAAAEARLAASGLRREAEARRLRAALEGARASLAAAIAEATALRERVVPWAREILDATTERFRAGKVGYLELLDARRTYADGAAREATALAEVHRGRIGIERLIAGPLEAVRGTGSPREPDGEREE